LDIISLVEIYFCVNSFIIMVYFLHSHHAKYFLKFVLFTLEFTNITYINPLTYFVNYSNTNHLLSMTYSSIHPIPFEGLLSSLIFNCLYSKSGYNISIHLLYSIKNY